LELVGRPVFNEGWVLDEGFRAYNDRALTPGA
jgi:hypothetical protein